MTAEQAAAMFGATAALVALLDDGGTALDLAGSVGYPAAFLERWRRIPLDAPLMVAGVVRARRPLVLPVLARDGSSPDAADLPPDAAGMAQRSFVAVPMLIGDRVHGSLALGFPSPARWPRTRRRCCWPSGAGGAGAGAQPPVRGGAGVA